MKTIILDDDELDRLMVLSCLRNYPEFEVVGVFSSPNEALTFLENNRVDVLFLDIDMPEMTGIELKKRIAYDPLCVFITGYPQHAVESFEVEALDFLVKPIKADRFKQTVSRIHEYTEIRQKVALFESSVGGDVIYIKEGHEQTKVKLHTILYLQAMKDYTLLFTAEKRHCVLTSLGNLLKEDAFQSFVRVHRSFAVQGTYIQRIGTNEVVLNNEQTIPLGRGYKENINTLL